MKYVLSIDQSTQGTKALLIDETGTLTFRADVSHQQLVDENGWISHDPEEIYSNVLRSIDAVVKKANISYSDIVCIGISNQRETALAWSKQTGTPVCHAIVWQCSRSKTICDRLDEESKAHIQACTGIPVSPYFPASKLAWILDKYSNAREMASCHKLCYGTIDTWLIYKLTGGQSYKTDYSNASRTQLFNIYELCWDQDVCQTFGLCADDFAEVCSSDAVYGYTTLEGRLDTSIPICGVLGDSHAALFGHGCLHQGMTKTTYGTGSSVMMNIGEKPIASVHGLVTSLAWKYKGVVQYVMEGNLNYTGAVIKWMEEDLGLVVSAAETSCLAKQANPEDTTYLIPAFSGLGAPYWNDDAKAMICGITRLTGKREIVKAGLECIAYQITDIVQAMEKDTGIKLDILRVDGGPTRNDFLMQFQADLLSSVVTVPSAEELSGIGAGYMAGLSAGIFDEAVFDRLQYDTIRPVIPEALMQKKYEGWKQSINRVILQVK